ncbi:poly(3-hydroxybutyrate) depolymerase [Algoriphagus iocasae]|uniref:Poly(3-hydroxybutyrate) depolymerase n=1 Tax=Algoriphagus iocasae TaxID=1836499 RepID=A0A841MCV8_9BACT|nr:alpha/beta hydrolase [Algoriphagus iocasae]MBB6324563.1 poly(3-hydroxybutyrate) depolymerase [Algoriphagus iocasae]
MKKALITLIVFVCLCSNISFCQTGESYEVVEYKEISYMPKSLFSKDTLRTLNLMLPLKDDKIPLLIWIGGGAWSYGDKNQEMDLAKKFAAQGIAVACIGHRLSPAIWRDSTLNKGIQHPKHIQDVAASVKWLYEKANEYGYDRDNFFIGGYSSGGHLAALISLDSTYLNQVGLSNKIFKGIIPISGTYDIVDYYNVMLNSGRPELAELHVEAVFGKGTESFKQASPVSYLQNLSRPLLLISDNNMYNYSKLFEEKIRMTEFRNMQVVYSYELSHGGLWRNLSFDEQSIYRQIVIKFIEKNSEKG